MSDELARTGGPEREEQPPPAAPRVLDADITRRALEGLARAEEHRPGHGKVDIFALAERDRLGGAVDYSHHVSRNVSAFAQGWAGAERDAFDRWRTGYGALGGLRVRW